MSSPGIGILPMVVVPLTFLFVLLIILINKAPKAGAWVVVGLLLLAPAFLWRFAATGAFAHEEAIPLFVVPVTVLFVLLVILLAKAPKIGTGLIVALIGVGLFAMFFMARVSHVRTAYVPEAPQAPLVPQQLPSVLDMNPVQPTATSPIWSQGVEEEFEADTYPSKVAAVRALGSRVYKTVREFPQDGNSPASLVLFQQEQDRGLILELKSAVQRLLPEAVCTIEAEMRNLQPKEIGVTLRFVGTHENVAPWAPSSKAVVVSQGTAEVDVFTMNRHMPIQQLYTEKPWVEDFAGFANARPELHFVVARSYETSTSPGEAYRQAFDDARSQIARMLESRPQRKAPRLPAPELTVRDVLNGGFIADRFDQSFRGSAGKIWRQALLIDVSAVKLDQLARVKVAESREMRESWARMGLSAVGVILLIGVIYFFLNMATRGYYEWSLRIACVVLAVVAVMSILMVVR